MMPALVSGTVVVWEVKDEGDRRVVRFNREQRVSIFTDGAGAGETPAIISKFILKYVPTGDQAQYLQWATDGLLQVYDIQRTAITPPPVPPPSSEAGQQAQSAKPTGGRAP
jgi:hypothetical protein